MSTVLVVQVVLNVVQHTIALVSCHGHHKITQVGILVHMLVQEIMVSNALTGVMDNIWA